MFFITCFMKRKTTLLRFAINFLLWILLSVFLLYFVYDDKAPLIDQFAATSLVTALTAIPAYFSTRWLVPRLLYRKKTVKFALAFLLAALVNTIGTYFIVGYLYYEVSGKSIFTHSFIIVYLLSFFFIVNCIVILVSSALRIISDRFGMEVQLHETEQEKVNTELAFLRAQINPHFLFNVLNTIYFQINQENTRARDLVERFSEMLRYQLYECTSDFIDISKEIAYIRNYVAIQQLRMEPGTDLQMHIGETGSFKIAPLLILPLVENAFKHISHFRDPGQNKLRITISVEPGSWFVMNIVNTHGAAEKAIHISNRGGVGIQNLERRLELLYPGRHSIIRTQNKTFYDTTLKIKFDELPGGG